MSVRSQPSSAAGVRARRASERLRNVLRQLAKGGPEQQAIEAGEIDAVIDYSGSNVILFPAARRALLERAHRVAKPPANGILVSLPRPEYRRLRSHLEPVRLTFGDVLHEPGEPIRHVYFPVDSVVCLLAVDNHRAVEVGLVGHEGMIGVSRALGVDVSNVRALVHTPGTAMRMQAARFQTAFRQCERLRRELYLFTELKLTSTQQAIACSRFHTVQERLARWLLMTGDRVRSDTFFLTHAFLADIFGARRVSVTTAASELRKRDLIDYYRGNIRILDRKGLENASCRCYTTIKTLHDGS
jgi:CRP-like cAMP-binding protein